MSQYCYTCMEKIREGNFCTSCMKENRPDPFSHHIRPGTMLNGKYLVGNCLGEGGFGITYIGRDLTLDIKVAIKEYYPNGYVNRTNDVTQHVTASTEARERFFANGKQQFLQEARNLAKFTGNPGIVNVREYFEANNTAYIIMDYLDGEDLGSYIKKHGTFDAEELFRQVQPMVESLQKIHEAGIIHRDISPDNIMRRTDGSLTLMDFGSARFFTNEEKEMSVLLKQGYAPEEQYRKNGKQGPWTDVYGLCATLYRCITGQAPEDALDRTRADNLKKPSDLGIRISKPLETVLMYGLAVFRENRCQSMQELSELIKKALQREEVSVKKSGKNVQEEIYRTQDADSYYKDRVSDDFSGNRFQNTKLCPRCKTEVRQEVKYCTNCGFDFQPVYVPPQPEPVKRQNNTLLYVILCAVVALLGAVVFLIVSNMHDKSDSDSEETVVEATVEPTETAEVTPEVVTPTPAPDYLLPDSSSRYLSVSELYGLSREELCFARNEIFARHGRMFNTPQIAAYFASKSWYVGTIPPDQFSANVLNAFERANIELISNYEDTFGGSYY